MECENGARVRDAETKAKEATAGALIARHEVHLAQKKSMEDFKAKVKIQGTSMKEKASCKAAKRKAQIAEQKAQELAEENVRLKKRVSGLEEENARLEERANELQKAAGKLARKMELRNKETREQIDCVRVKAVEAERALVQAQWRATKAATNRATVKKMLEHMKMLLDSPTDTIECISSRGLGEKLMEMSGTPQLFGNELRRSIVPGFASGTENQGCESVLRYISKQGKKDLGPGGETAWAQPNPSGGSGLTVTEKKTLKKKICSVDHKRASKRLCGGSQGR